MTIQELKDKILLKIRGASTGSSEKTKAVDHREVLIDVVDTLEALIPVAIDGDDGLGWTSGSYNDETGIVTFLSDDGLGFATDDLRGADGINGTNGTNGQGLPVGGATGQVPIKNSNTDFDISWGTPVNCSMIQRFVGNADLDGRLYITHSLNTTNIAVLNVFAAGDDHVVWTPGVLSTSQFVIIGVPKLEEIIVLYTTY